MLADQVGDLLATERRNREALLPRFLEQAGISQHPQVSLAQPLQAFGRVVLNP